MAATAVAEVTPPNRPHRRSGGDVLVVGGGATGAGVARDLALRGIDVTLVERDGLTMAPPGDRTDCCTAVPATPRQTGWVPRSASPKTGYSDIAGACIRDTGGLFVQLAGDDPDYPRDQAGGL